MYKKVVKERLIDLLLASVVSKSVCITVPATLLHQQQVIMKETLFKLDYNLVSKSMTIGLPRLQLELTSQTFSMLTKFIFNNIIFTDGFVLEPDKPKR